MCGIRCADSAHQCGPTRLQGKLHVPLHVQVIFPRGCRTD